MDNDIRQHLDARRDAAAFELVVERYRDKVFRLAYSMMRNETQAEDVAQDVFVKIWKALPAYDGSASLSTWIYTITRNTTLTELKKRTTRPTVSLQEPELEAGADSIPALQIHDAGAGAEMDVEILLERLPEKYRQVITLFYLEQKAYEEVATLLGIPLGTVKTLLFRAKKELLRIGARHTQQADAPQPRPAPRPSITATGNPFPGPADLPLSPNLII